MYTFKLVLGIQSDNMPILYMYINACIVLTYIPGPQPLLYTH